MSPVTVILLTLLAMLVLAFVWTSLDETWASKQIPSKKPKGWWSQWLDL